MFYKRYIHIYLCSVALLLQLELKDLQARVQIPYELSVLTDVKEHSSFQEMVCTNENVHKKKLYIFPNVVCSTQEYLGARLVQKTLDTLKMSQSFGLHRFVM